MENLKKKEILEKIDSYSIEFKKLPPPITSLFLSDYYHCNRFLLDAHTKGLSNKHKHTGTNISFDSTRIRFVETRPSDS